jgi:PKD repeat protein
MKAFKRIIFLFITLCLSFDLLFAQAPIITSFTPASAKPGDTITIVGSGFNPITSNNIVFFGATRAMIVAVTGGILKALVPVGATYAPITILNTSTNLICASLSNFNPIFNPSKNGITPSDFLSNIDFITGINSNSYNVAIGDLDGDGKADIVVVNSQTNNISIFRNISTIGSITNVSFSAKVDFTTDLGPQSVAIGDIDCDGKLDLVVTNALSSNVSVFRNTSTIGVINSSSFAPKVNFISGINPSSVKISDLDNDGRPDMAVANASSNTISVFRNVSTIGSITINSFSPKVDFTTSSNPYFIAVGDLDGDMKSDLAVVNYSSNTVSVFHNKSTSGNIFLSSFASKVDFATGASPRSIVIGDLDGDGKPDIAVANYGSSTISILRNTSTSGNIGSNSFASKVDFATSSNLISIGIGDINGDEKLDLTFGHLVNDQVSVFLNTSSLGSINSSSFASKIDYTTGSIIFSIAIGDLDGDGKPDLATTSGNTLSVLRNSDRPTINSYSPLSGCSLSDSILITGKYFTGATSVNIGGKAVSFFTVISDTQIKVTSEGSETGTISVTTPSGTVTSNGTVTIYPKPLLGFTTNTATQCLNINNYLFADTSKISSGTINRLWTLGSGDTTSIINPSKVFSNAGTYSIKLFAISDNGCKDSLIKTVTVYPNTTVGFKINNTMQCINGNSFLYTDTSIISSGSYTRLWNFGDASTVTTSPFTKTYANANTYQVKLVTTSNNGCKDSITKPVIVNPKPDVYFMINNEAQCLKGNQFSFADSSVVSNGSLTRKWNLGDGSIDSVLVASKKYNQANIYSVKLLVSSNNDCKDSIIRDIIVYPQPMSVAIAQGRTIICPSEMVNIKASTTNGITYQWLKNEVLLPSAIDSVLQTSTQGIYKVITNTAYTCTDTSQGVSVVVNPLPKAQIGINNSAQCLTGNQFQYTDSSTIVSGTLHRLWYLNDVLSDTSFNINKSYNSAGNYSIKLVSLSETNCKDSITKIVVVNPQPIPDFTINNASQCLVPNNFVFTDVSSIASGNTSRTWYIDNGNMATTLVTSQEYSSLGNHIVKLVSKSDKACSDSISKTIMVNANPLAGVMLGQTTNLAPATPYIYAVAQQLNHTYLWSLTNGIVLAGQGTNAVTIQWIGVGAGKIQTIITNAQGCNDTSSLILNISNVGINEAQNTFHLQVFPNPNNGSFIIKAINNKTSNTHISVVNMLGQEVWSATQILPSGLQEVPIITSLSTGIYLLSFKNENGLAIKHIIVE